MGQVSPSEDVDLGRATIKVCGKGMGVGGGITHLLQVLEYRDTWEKWTLDTEGTRLPWKEGFQQSMSYHTRPSMTPFIGRASCMKERRERRHSLADG